MLTKNNIKITDSNRLKIIETKSKLFNPKNEEDAFYELCFCICSPQTTFNKNSMVNKELKKLNYFNNYIAFPILCDICYKIRFYNRKAVYLIEAKQKWNSIWEEINRIKMDFDKRIYLVKNVKGLGMKTASHFLRNSLGCEHFAIIDTHVLKFLESKQPKNQWGYYLLEGKFTAIAQKLNLTPLELDIYIFSHYSNIPLESVR